MGPLHSSLIASDLGSTPWPGQPPAPASAAGVSSPLGTSSPSRFLPLFPFTPSRPSDPQTALASLLSLQPTPLPQPLAPPLPAPTPVPQPHEPLPSQGLVSTPAQQRSCPVHPTAEGALALAQDSGALPTWLCHGRDPSPAQMPTAPTLLSVGFPPPRASLVSEAQQNCQSLPCLPPQPLPTKPLPVFALPGAYD